MRPVCLFLYDIKAHKFNITKKEANMPFDSQGKFSRIHNWEQDRINDIDIVSERHDEEDDNFATGLNECMLRDGRCVMNGDLNMGNFQIKNVGRGQSNSDAVNRKQLNDLEDSLTQDMKTEFNATAVIGDIKASLQTSNHGNWLLCDGQAVSRTTYAELFELIGTKFGSGDGTTTFNVPDYRGKFLRGLGGNSAVNFETTQAEGLPNITGSLRTVNSGSRTGAFYDGDQVVTDWITGGGNLRNVNFDASRSSSIYGASNHVTPVNQAVNWFIRAKNV